MSDPVPEPADWVTRHVTIVNPHGFHARPVMRFVDLAGRFEAMVQVEKDGQTVDGKSPMELMLLEGVKGARLTLRACGSDADDAVKALAKLVTSGFDEMQ